LSLPAIAAEDSIQQSQLILLHQPAPRAVQVSPETEWAGMLRSEQQQAGTLYAQLFEDLQLTQTQSEALTGLLAEHSTLTADWWASSGRHFPPDHQRARAVLSQIEQLLGPAGFQRFEEYRRTLDERFQLKRLASLLIAVGYPLTSEQSSQLVSIMRAERGDQLQHWPNSDEFDRRIKPRFDAVLSVEQREFAERYFAGRAERRHKTLGYGRAAD
jgi:hypothetical protein